MSARRAALIGSMLMVCGLVLAGDEDIPDMEFLEYLGLWEESDEDWVLLTDIVTEQVAAEDQRTDPAAQEEESVETDDES